MLFWSCFKSKFKNLSVKYHFLEVLCLCHACFDGLNSCLCTALIAGFCTVWNIPCIISHLGTCLEADLTASCCWWRQQQYLVPRPAVMFLPFYLYWICWLHNDLVHLGNKFPQCPLLPLPKITWLLKRANPKPLEISQFRPVASKLLYLVQKKKIVMESGGPETERWGKREGPQLTSRLALTWSLVFSLAIQSRMT